MPNTFSLKNIEGYVVVRLTVLRSMVSGFFLTSYCTVSMYSRSRTNNKIAPLTNLGKYLYNGKSEIKVNINNNSEKV